MGERYLVGGRGFCMGDSLPEGSQCWADPDAPISPGQMVSVELNLDSVWGGWLLEANADYGTPDTFIVRVGKIFLRQHHHPKLGELIYLGCINPPNIAVFRRSDIVLMHAIVAIEGELPARSESDKLGYALITTLCDNESMQPINPPVLPVVALKGSADKLAAITEAARLNGKAA
jgi:hypothetical protein